MKQFKCSMSKKIESLAKKQEAISGKDLMDPEQFEKDIREMIDGEYEDILKGCDDKKRQYYEMAWQIWDDGGYDYAGELYKKLQQQMYEYVSGNDYRMSGNFANIQWDWDDDHKDGIKFADLRKKLLDGVNDADTDEFSTWAIDWFFHAFGTYNMCYNFANDLGEEAATLEQEDEEERERENSDESKKSEGISDMIDAKIDYNMFMRMCKTAAYLEEDEDYWDALWEYYSEVGSIGDALVFFDNLFQYTSWKTAEELWTDYSNILGDKPEGKDYEEALDAYLDENDNEVGRSAVYKYGDHYLMLH